MITITAIERSPDAGRGLARDTRVRWALEEAGLAYRIRPVPLARLRDPAHLALNPFGQIPTLEEDGLVLFESGAILLHVAARCPALLPAEPAARARATMWLVAALNTVEPPILDLVVARLVEGDRPWREARMPLVLGRVEERLAQLSARLGGRDWLEGAFGIGDLAMVSVLTRLGPSGLLAAHPRLAAYVTRGEARPAYARAFAAQAADYAAQSAAAAG